MSSHNDGNEFYLSNEKFSQQVSLVQYVIDEMSLETVIRPHPIGFKQKLRV